MLLFEDRAVEALYLEFAKSSRRAKFVPPFITAFILFLTISIIYAADHVNVSITVTSIMLAAVPAAAGLAVSFAQTCRPRLHYQLRAVGLGLAAVAAMMAFLSISSTGGISFGPTSTFGVLWVCQKSLVISDVVAVRVVVVVGIFNTLVLLLDVGMGLTFLNSIIVQDFFTPAGVIQTAFELGTAVIASSGVLLWLSFRNESASRTVFYWSRVVNANVKVLDAEANPFHQRRLLDWLSREAKTRELVNLSKIERDDAREFWELDGSLLRLDSKIAAGGGGVVWKGTYNGKAVAAKQLYGGFHTGSDQLQELATEVSVLAQLSHVNIVRFLGLSRGPDGSQAESSVYLPLFIVQEYCSTNLRAALRDVFPSMPSVEWQAHVLRVALEIARAMAYLHGRKVVHHDLKPENVLLTEQNTVRVADFGVSVQFLGETNSTERTGGTLAYMAPELMCEDFFSSRNVTQAALITDMCSDVYAYGTILCELVHSDSSAGLMDELAGNAVSNRELRGLAHATQNDVDLEHEWAFPPFRDAVDFKLRHVAELCRQCCAFYSDQRPSFVDLCRQLTDWHDNASGHGAGQQPKSRRRSTSDMGSRVNDVRSAPRTPGLSAASIDPSATFTSAQHTQVALGRCACSWWTQPQLRFEDGDMENRFVAFLHSAEFFRSLRWPYIVLATLHLGFMVAMVALDRSKYALYPLTCALLYGAAAAFSWLRRMQRFSMLTLLALAVVSTLIQCATVWADVMYLPLDGLDNTSFLNISVCVCDASTPQQCPASCRVAAFEWLYINFLLPLLQDLTTPVTLLVLGLPFYMYVWLFALTLVSWMGTVAAGLFVWQEYVESLIQMDFWAIVVPGLALFPICALTAVAGERMQRQMFLRLCSLRSEEDNLLEHATFRGYREALLANWRFLSEPKSNSSNPRSHHVVTAATV